MKNGAQNIKITQNRVVKVRLEDIYLNPAQPRLRFDVKKLESLAESISQNGLLQPLSVRKIKGGYELISGERRLRALKLLGEDTAPCIVTQVDEEKSAVLALIENIQREDLNIFEEAEAISRLITVWDITQTDAAERLGLSQSAIANKMRVLRLPSEERRIIVENGLTERHARALLKISDSEMRKKALRHIAAASLNVEQSEIYIEKLIKPKKEKNTRFVFKDLRIFTNTINMAIETMRRSGVMATAQKGESEGFIEYTIRIPKRDAVLQK